MDTNKPSLWKQLLGAVGGGVLGLALYTGYGWAQPAVQGWLTVPSTGSETDVSGNATENEVKRIGARARAIAEEFSNTQNDYMIDEEEFAEPALKEAAAQPVVSDPVPEASESEHASAEPFPSEAPGEPVELGNEAWQELIRKEPAYAQENAVAESQEAHEGAPLLPSSGFGAMAVLSIAAGAAGALFRRGVFIRLLSRI